MKRLCTTLLWSLAIVSMATAQPTFFKRYQSDGFFFWGGLAAGSDGESMAALSFNANAAIISKLDAGGSAIWGRAFRDAASDNPFNIIGDIVGTADGGFVAVAGQSAPGAHTVFFKVNGEGGLLWAYRLPGVVSWTDYGLDVDRQGNKILLSTSLDRAGFFLLCTNPEGQLQWAKKYTIEGYEDYFYCSAVFTPDNKALLYGGVSPTRNTDDEVNYIRLEIDATAGTAEEALFSENTRAGVIAFDEQGNRYESHISADGPRYAKYAPDGQPTWCKRIQGVPVGSDFRLSPGFLNIISNHSVESETYILRLNQADGGLAWSKVYTGANYAPLFSNVNLISRPQGGLAWLATTDDGPATAIGQVDAQGEVEGCITHSPCSVSAEDAPFPEYTSINWTEEGYSAYEPMTLLEEPVDLTDIPYCDEHWFSAEFTATSLLCAGDSIQVRQQETGLDVASEWSFEGAAPPSSTHPSDTVRYDTPGSFTIRHIAGAFGCRDTAYAEVRVQESPEFTLGPDTAVCSGETVVLSSGLQPGQYILEWQDGSNAPTFNTGEPGAYILTAANDAGCTRSDTLFLSIHPPPAVELGPDTTLCGASSLEIVPQTDASQPAYQWSTAALIPRLQASSEGLYSLTVTDGATGCAGQDSIRITFSPPILLRPLPDTSVCPGRPVLLEIQPLSGAPLSVQWEDGATDNPYAIAEPGTYGVRVSDGACDTLLNILVLPGDCRPGIFLPNAFSPNNDGRNDFFQPFGSDIELAHLRVFSRWGSLLYDEQGADARWDGAASGKPAPAGAYVYRVEYRIPPEEEMKVAAGEVMLVR